MEEKKEYMFKLKVFGIQDYDNEVVLVSVSFLREFSSNFDALEYFTYWITKYAGDFGVELVSAKVYETFAEKSPELVATLYDVEYVK